MSGVVGNLTSAVTVSSLTALVKWGVFFPLLTVLPGWLLLRLVHDGESTEVVSDLVVAVGLGVLTVTLIGFSFALAPVVYGGVVVALTAAVWYRDRLPSAPTFRLQTLGYVAALVTVPVASATAVTILNRGGDGTATVAVVIGIVTLAVGAYVADFDDEHAYPVLALGIGVGVALLYGVRHQNVPNGDIAFEYFVFQQTLEAGRWDLALYPTGYTKRVGTLWSTTVLPVAYHYLLGANEEVYLVGYRLLSAVLPLVGYLVAEKFLERRDAFLVSVFVVGQVGYVTMIASMARVQVAFFLFYVTMLVFFSRGYSDRTRKVLLFVLTLGVVVAHYTTALITLALFAGYWGVAEVLPRLRQAVSLRRVPDVPDRTVTFGLFGLLVTSQFVFYGVVTDQVLGAITEALVATLVEIPVFLIATLQSFGDTILEFVESLVSGGGEPSSADTPGATPAGTDTGATPTDTGATPTDTGNTPPEKDPAPPDNEGTETDSSSQTGDNGGGSSTSVGGGGLPYRLTLGIYALSSIAAALGSGLNTLQQFLRGDTVFDSRFGTMLSVAAGLFGAGVFALFAYGAYDPHRLLLQLSVFLGPAIVFGLKYGGETVQGLVGADWLRSSTVHKVSSVLLVVVVVLQFTAGTYLVFQLAGVGHAEYMNPDGDRNERYYVNDAELEAAAWLAANSGDTDVWTDFYGENIYAQYDPGDAEQGIGMPWWDANQTQGDYVFLRCYNTRTGLIDPVYVSKVPINETGVLENKTLVFEAGCARVYK